MATTRIGDRANPSSSARGWPLDADAWDDQVVPIGASAMLAANIVKDATLKVLIRTFLHWSLELEISGRWLWQKRLEEVEEPAPADASWATLPPPGPGATVRPWTGGRQP